MEHSLKLSVLDQSPAARGETSVEALQHTIQLAKKAEEWGYGRFWVAEHHGSNRVMGSSPEVLMSYLLAQTHRIRIGSGGVMLQHYSPYKVAENFSVLASLAPGRIDLGVGRGPGGMPRTTQALRPQFPDESRLKSLDEKLVELMQFLKVPQGSGEALPEPKVTATPVPPAPPELFMLGTTSASAAVAAKQGLPYVFAMFLNGDEAEMRKAVDTYYTAEGSRPGFRPRAMLALPVIVAPSDKEAADYARDIRVFRIRLDSGRTFTVFSEEAANEFGRQSAEKFTYEVQEANVIHGTPDAVKERLLAMSREYGVDEVFIVTAIDNFSDRLRSYDLLSDCLIRESGERVEQEVPTPELRQ